MAGDPVRLAYADPPYPRQSKKWYGDHPDYDGEVDHGALVAQLEAFDGWALSTSARALREVLALCPPDVRIGVWNRTNSEPPGNRGSWHWTWEPVIFSPARHPEEATRDVYTSAMPGGFLRGEIAGQKPDGFSEWVFRLMGARPEDDLDDLFRGSGAVGRAWDRWTRQARLLPLPPVEQLANRMIYQVCFPRPQDRPQRNSWKAAPYMGWPRL